MRTGNGKIGHESRAIGLRFHKGRLIVEFDDQREVSVPLSHYPTLRKARSVQRNDWELIGPGKGFYFRSLDLDLSVSGLIAGLPEMIPPPPPRPQKRRAVARMR